ncbi:MAG: DoxX family protein [uncultured Campylobacterales bacterium]|uniref:DoxX family protein n=1 Tax=uncultured Campylobacterales bacterium TaxID=352960 RepID=A0A6S6SNR1_9BACT|nr:MAG: DoxX family protein [uncultured Campylobacterales bacterium]
MFTFFELIFNSIQSLALLFARLLVAYGFYEPAKNKLMDIEGTTNFFTSINIPMPEISAYLAAGTEIVGVLLLTFGLFTRLISIPLLFVMGVAIFVVHFDAGFSAAANGFEIPLYYASFLMIFLSFGSGKFSLDYLLFQKNR